MPQEVAMPRGFTVQEILRFFGRLAQLSTSQMAFQFRHLMELLRLPADDRPFEQLSGGQQRRVSLACALLGRPPLLVLDEPTVGVDPLLRDIIWRHIGRLCAVEGVTVILTTHYIEEARSADIIALMRHGRLVAEDDPTRLLAQHQQSQIEEVFLQLSLLQDASEQGSPEELQNRKVSSDKDNSSGSNKCQIKTKHTRNSQKKWDSFELYRVYALFLKNKTYFRRIPIATFFNLIAPTLITILVVYTWANTIKRLSLVIVNDESPPQMTADFFCQQDAEVVAPVRMTSLEAAIQSVVDGEHIAVLHFYRNFSEAFKIRQTLVSFDLIFYSLNISELVVLLGNQWRYLHSHDFDKRIQ